MKQKSTNIGPLEGVKQAKSTWPELVVSTTALNPAIRRAVMRGELKSIASRFYTSNLRESVEAIVRRHYLEIVATAYPGAVISDRSAATSSLIVDGLLFITYPKFERNLNLPGLSVRPRLGVGALSSDISLGSGVFLASPARTVVENLEPARVRAGIRRRLTVIELELYLDRILRQRGIDPLKQIADALPKVAKELELDSQGQVGLRLVREFLGTYQAKATTSLLRARQQGYPYDPDRLQKFAQLVEELQQIVIKSRAVVPGSQPQLPLFESYFSNYIEGTEFELDEARAIIESGEVPSLRPADAHDILGVFNIVVDDAEMSRVPENYQDFKELLEDRHRKIMSGRPEKHPGQIKTLQNRVGLTTFVAPELAEGTLAEGLKIAEPLTSAFARAVYFATLLSEVHPFDDGNGRISRIFMNAELVAAEEQRIIVPTALRDSYLSGLRKFSNTGSAKSIVAVFDFAQRYTRAIDWSSFARVKATLERTHALFLPQELDDQNLSFNNPSVFEKQALGVDDGTDIDSSITL